MTALGLAKLRALTRLTHLGLQRLGIRVADLAESLRGMKHLTSLELDRGYTQAELSPLRAAVPGLEIDGARTGG